MDSSDIHSKDSYDLEDSFIDDGETCFESMFNSSLLNCSEYSEYSLSPCIVKTTRSKDETSQVLDSNDNGNIVQSKDETSKELDSNGNDNIVKPTVEEDEAGPSNDPHGTNTHKEPSKRSARQIYLITYSGADVLLVPGRKEFAKIITEEFDRFDQVTDQWIVSVEMHRKKGVHFHMALKLQKERRWAQVRKNVKKKYDIDLDFQDWHSHYYDAFTYVSKFDTHYQTSEGHPVLENPPSTDKAIAAKRERSSTSGDAKDGPSNKSTKKPFKHPKLRASDMGQIIRKNGLRTENSLYVFAKMQAKEGKFDVDQYLLSHPSVKHHADLINTVWRIEDSVPEEKRSEMGRIKILENTLKQSCFVNTDTGFTCERKWLSAALETLFHNGISRKRFSDLVLNSLKYGRGKGRNLMICGPTNCAKSFLLMPLTEIYDCFMTPSDSTYNWVDAPNKEVIFLNDIRYEQEGERRVMAWNKFLNLLEGATINVSMPKNHFAKDMEWKKRQPIFATSEKPIVRVINGKLDTGETAQMEQRWNLLTFRHQYLRDDVNYDLEPCPRCFAELILKA